MSRNKSRVTSLYNKRQLLEVLIPMPKLTLKFFFFNILIMVLKAKAQSCLLTYCYFLVVKHVTNVDFQIFYQAGFFFTPLEIQWSSCITKSLDTFCVTFVWISLALEKKKLWKYLQILSSFTAPPPTWKVSKLSVKLSLRWDFPFSNFYEFSK